jgi:hypothetical protein
MGHYAAEMHLDAGKPAKTSTEYLLVTDKDSKILKSSLDRFELIRLANIIRKGGGEVTIFKSTKA